ncbi:MAG: outer membrane protein assembly factor BamB family protein, partial [Planctomycetota bacterium]
WTFYALDLKTGKPVWQHSSAFNVCGETAIAYGKLYQVSGGGHIYCYAPAKNGEPTTPGARDTSPPALPEEVKKILARKATFGKGWPMAGGAPERNGREGVTLKESLAPAWKFETGRRVQCEPAIVDGKVYIGSNSGSFFALDGASGKALWEKKTGSPMRCAPAVADSVVYTGSDGGVFYALDAAGGAEKWKFECGGPVRGAPAVVGGAVIFGANDHNIYALDRETGRKLWNFRTRYYRHHAAPVVHGDTVYALPGIDYVHAIDIVTGKERWKTFCVKTGEGLSYYKGRLWAHGWCAAEIDAAKGGVTRFACGPRYGYNRIACMNDRIYIAGTAGGQCLDFNDPGKEVALPVLKKGDHKAGRMPSQGKSIKFRSTPQAASPAASPVPLGDRLVFTAMNGQVSLSKPDGSIMWTGELGASTHASPGVGCGMIVIGDDRGTVHCFREK